MFKYKQKQSQTFDAHNALLARTTEVLCISKSTTQNKSAALIKWIYKKCVAHKVHRRAMDLISRKME